MFNEYCLSIFQYQYQYNKVYQQFANNVLKRKSSSKKLPVLKHYTEIPFLPIEFFKTHTVTCFPVSPKTVYFESSGTTQHALSRHYVLDEKVYQQSILHGFTRFYGNPEDYLFIFLLPDEKTRPHSSLVYMANYLRSLSKHPDSGFYLNDFARSIQVLKNHLSSNKKIFLLGLSYALMDFFEASVPVSDTVIIMETGGMKGKKEEMPKKYFHQYLKSKLSLSGDVEIKNGATFKIHSEYGMTELFSQAYSSDQGIFRTPPWMKVCVRELDDPLTIYTKDKQGAINVIDLANIHTCSFIATSDIGKLYSDGSFEILGRSDFSDIRGCNLMYG